jgi:MraZ protein
MFKGKFSITIDPKGRISVPVKLRSDFVEADGSFMTVTRHPHGCLMVFPRDRWLVKQERLLQLPMSAEAWKRMFVGNATDIEIDDSGRVLIPAELRKPVGLDKSAVLMGMGGHLELWDEAAITKMESDTAAAGVPDSIANFVF